jgi:dynein heavy chain, axonemal
MMIEQARKNGDWVCLQNCHVACSWMLKLESIVEDLSRESTIVHEDFRLWLTAMPSSTFPVLVLQNGLKLTNEPPQGVKAKVKNAFTSMSLEQFEAVGCKPEAWKKLLLSLTFFHAVVQERRKFGPIGWNIRYEFNLSDLECSQRTIQMFLEEKEHIPWAAMEYVLGQINYGGRVTDENDQRCLMSILRQYIVPEVLHTSYKYTPSGTYHSAATAGSTLEDISEYIRSLPPSEAPEVFGMHLNANIKSELQECRKLLHTVLAIQPRVAESAAGRTPEEVVLSVAVELLNQIPPVRQFPNVSHGVP